MRIRLFKLFALSVMSVAVTDVHAELTFEKRLLAIDPNEACEIADYNNDGVLDISAGRNWYAGPDYTPRPVRAIAEFGKDYQDNNGEHAYDVDGDGWTDIVAGVFKGKEVHWYKNPGEHGLKLGKLWVSHKLQDTTTQNEITYLRDFNADDKPEYVANSWNARVPQLIWSFQTVDKNITLHKCEVGTANGHGIGFGDINGNGREDLLFQSGWYERPDGDPLAQPWILHEDWMYKHASCPMIVVDLNEDGRNDVIWGSGHNYGVYWMEQLAPKEGKTQWQQHVIDKAWSQAHALAWTDIDGDGDNDLITGKRVRAHSGGDPGAGEPPAIYYYTWDKAQSEFTRHTIVEGVGTGLFIRTADLDKNGKIDIVVSGKSGTYLLFNR